ncbi:MAG: threonine synthase [Nitrososphaerota archaeon]
MECRECGKQFGHILAYVCDECFGALEANYDPERISVTKSKVEAREPSMWRYWEFLPLISLENKVDIGAGYTPLIRAERLGKKLGVKSLYIKNDTVNPTHSFKDRPASLAVSKGREFGLNAVGCASTGNLAGATAAHATAGGLPCYVFMPSSVEKAKIKQAALYGAQILLVQGTYDDANRLAALAADRLSLGIVNVNLRPYYVEGSKTMGLEIIEQLGWRSPDRIIVPTASGALLSAIYKGIKEAELSGLIGGSGVSMVCAQPLGCSPIVKAFRNGGERIEPVRHPDTIVQSLAIGDPGDGYQALRVLRESGGAAVALTDDEAVEAVQLLASTEGIFAEPGGAISVAALKKLVELGEIDGDEEIVCCVTGSGLKTIEIIPEPTNVKLIPPTLEGVRKATGLH